MKTIIETQHLLLREFNADDLPALTRLFSDSDVMHFYPATPEPAERAQKLLERCQQFYQHYGYGLWATIYKPTGEFIGRCGLYHWDFEEGPEVEVGYMIAKAYWNRGLATEAARACRDYGFQHLDVPRIISLIRPENTASVRVALKNGMQVAGERMLGEYYHHVYAIDRGCWGC
jgi:ribosomal-protein-alanine N-acetyltransferase